jgi:penicillin amidase
MKRFFKRIALLLLLIVLLTIVGCGAWLYHRAHSSLPLLDGTMRAPGLSARVEVLRDAHGVPHLRAQSLADVFFAQGYVTAQDRLWQMDLSRRHAEGQLSEVFGDRTLRYDMESRTLGLNQAAERALAELDPDTRRLLDSYARGVNAFIESHRDGLPIEFLILRYQPQLWRTADSVAVVMNLSTALSQSWEEDLMREHVSAKLGKNLASDVFPDHSALDVPVAAVPASAPAGTKKMTRGFDDEPLEDCPLRAMVRRPHLDFRGGMGSNNWVLNGSHTNSGRPLLANDPHLGHSIPSVWYMIHLQAPGLNVSGVSLAGLPLVVIGHNEHIAWGVTNTGPDVQDLYAENFNLRDSTQYLHNGQWIGAEVRNEVIKVRDHRDYLLTVKVTRHGPVVSHDGDRDLALRWTVLEPHAIRLPLLRMNQASNWQEFTTALRDFTVPMQNFVYADVEGNIGYYTAGLVPVRRRGDGSVPIPGSTDDYDWSGFIPFEDLPHSYNPPGGIIATANGRIVPDTYPFFISANWEAPYRTARIFQLLREEGPFNPADMLRIQTDIRALEDEWLAKQLLAAAAQHAPESSATQFALGVLKAWDGQAHADSAATLIAEVTRHALLARILKPKLGEDLSGYHWSMSTIFLQNVLEQNLTRWLPPEDADFHVTLMKSLEQAVRQIPALVHSQSQTAWRWGDTIPLTFHHPLSRGLPLLGHLLDVGPFPQAGTGTSVKQTTPEIGPSMRMVVDFSDLDQSMQNITLGESGQVFSPYYRDQFEAWYGGRSFPMLFSDAAVDKGAVHSLVLEPGP